MNILAEADMLTSGDRNKSYGSPLDNHGCTAAMWSAYLSRRHGVSLTLSPEDVCFLNVLQKCSRAANSADVKRDTIVDIAGYARNAEMVQDARK